MAATRNFAPLNTRTIAVCVLLTFTSSLISCGTVTGPATTEKTSLNSGGQAETGRLVQPVVVALRVVDISPRKSGATKRQPGNGEQIALGSLKGAATGVGACARIGGGSLGVFLFLVCAPVGLVGGAVVGAATTAHDLRPASASIPVSADRQASAPAGLLAALEDYAASNGIATVRMPSATATRYQKPQAQTPAKLLDIGIVRVFYGHGEVSIETRIQVISLPDRTVVDSYSFTGNASESAYIDDETTKRAYLEVARAALDESILVYRGGAEGSVAVETEKAPKTSANASPFPDYALRPLQPKFTNNSFVERQESSKGPEVDSLQPVFQWEKLPARFDNDRAFSDGIRNLTYEFKLYRGQSVVGQTDMPREEVAHARKGLVQPSLALETPLLPCTHYYWTVRAHFDLEGQARVTEWAGAYELEGANTTPSSYRRNRPTASAPPPTLAVLYPEFHTKGECAGSVNRDDQTPMEMGGYLGGNK